MKQDPHLSLPCHAEVSLALHPQQAALKDDTAHIIVSRSHAGDVKAVATAAFGDKIEVIPAGGAGEGAASG